jgi:hypothetical protein
MKKLILLLSLVVISKVLLFSATPRDEIEVYRAQVDANRKEIIAEVMELSGQERAEFWELYGEYRNKVYKINSRRVDLIVDYLENYDTLTDEKAETLLRIWNQTE